MYAAGFHTFDYARHFLSCCSRMLGIEHVASRGSIMLDYYGRDVGVKIMPTGVNPNRYLTGFEWNNTKWRIGELVNQVPTSRNLWSMIVLCMVLKSVSWFIPQLIFFCVSCTNMEAIREKPNDEKKAAVKHLWDLYMLNLAGCGSDGFLLLVHLSLDVT